MTPPQTVTILTNPYAVHDALSTAQLELIVLCALACFVLGILLAEGHTLSQLGAWLRRLSFSSTHKRHPAPAPRPANYSN